MLYNKNIILELLRRDFWDEIESFVDHCVLDMDEEELNMLFEADVDYAVLDYIERMRVVNYDISKEEESDTVSGAVDITADIDAYRRWDGESIHVGSGVVGLGLSFEFTVVEDSGQGLELEWLY